MNPGRVTSPHIWSPTGEKAKKSQKQFQPVTFNPSTNAKTWTSSPPSSSSSISIAPKSSNDCSAVSQKSSMKTSLKTNSNKAIGHLPANKSNNNVGAAAGRRLESEPNRELAFDTLSSLLQSNEDTDSNFSEDYQAILNNDPKYTKTCLKDWSAGNSSNEQHRNWFNDLKFKSQKQEFNNTANHVYCYPYIEISSTIKVKDESVRDKHRRKGGEDDKEKVENGVIGESCSALKENKHAREENASIIKNGSTRTKGNAITLPLDVQPKRSEARENINTCQQPDAKYKMEVYKNQPLKIEEYEPGLRSSIFLNRQAKEKKSSSLRWCESDADVDYDHNYDDCGASNDHNWEDSGYLSSSGFPDGSERWRREQASFFARQASLEHVLAEEREAKLRREIMENKARRHHDTFMPREKNFVPGRYDQLPDARMTANSRIKGRARVLFTFQPQHENELALKRGDVVQLLRRVDANWYKGELNGKVGVFPSNYVDVIVSLEEAERLAHDREGRAVAIYDFVGRSPLELSLEEGDELMLIRRIDDNWYEGRLRGKQGIFPSSYVEVIRPPLSRPNTPAYDESRQTSRCSSAVSMGPDLPSPWNSDAYESEFEKDYFVSPSKVLNISITEGSRGLGVAKAARNKWIEQSNKRSQQPKKTNSTHFVTKFNGQESGSWRMQDKAEEKLRNNRHNTKSVEFERTPRGKKIQVIDRCQALYNYSPQNDDELKLKEGDVISIVEKCDDGWFIGFCEGSKTFGTFPGNYVTIF